MKQSEKAAEMAALHVPSRLGKPEAYESIVNQPWEVNKNLPLWPLVEALSHQPHAEGTEFRKR